MSFVLQALKKQEAGTDPDAAVSLARAALQQRRQRLWAALFAVAMLANGALLLWMFGVPRLAGPDEMPGAELPEAALQTRQPAPESDHSERSVEATAPRTAGQPDASSAAAEAGPVSDASPTITVEPPPDTPTRIALADLPPPARARFPGIAFSTHIYSDDPGLRAVVANGHRLEEGDQIRGLEIVEITDTGVVLAFEGYQVEIPIVVDWNAP